ncbi:hypothetical protein Sgleb_49180 [Streptomyces glebosus]|uniref:Histidine kinase/HSP90-like ATPase domain-containing protein n=1 Tax=Streptomyces glebosus TaxID=249580 RepID=A0A640T300_9ACTN|nr:hypothetical protein Sgleb_49180 [Streptomyces glebosus]GHG86503.1 hypothetical protein GCM10010513_67850 [Streptomyces glebosus]
MPLIPYRPWCGAKARTVSTGPARRPAHFTDNLTPAPDPERADTFLLVVSELATNALRHGGGRYTLRLSAGPDTLTAAVSDLSAPVAGLCGPA